MLSQGHHPSLRSPWRSVAGGTPGVPGEVPSASVDLNASNYAKYSVKSPSLIYTVLMSACKTIFLLRLGQTSLSACSTLPHYFSPSLHLFLHFTWLNPGTLPPPSWHASLHLAPPPLLPPALPFNICNTKLNKHPCTGCNSCNIGALPFLQYQVQCQDLLFCE